MQGVIAASVVILPHHLLICCSRKCDLCNLQGGEGDVMITSMEKQNTSLKLMTLSPWSLCSEPSKQFSLSSPFSLPSSASSFCFIHLVNRYLLSTCQVSGPVGNRKKTQEENRWVTAFEKLPFQWGLWCSLISIMGG